MNARKENENRGLFIQSEIGPLKNMLDEELKCKRDYDFEHGRKSDILTIELSESDVTTIHVALEIFEDKIKETNVEMEQDLDREDECIGSAMKTNETLFELEKDFSKTTLELGEAIANLADFHRSRLPFSGMTFGQSCGIVIGMALNDFSLHDNSADILQAAEYLKKYVEEIKKQQSRKIMLQ